MGKRHTWRLLVLGIVSGVFILSGCKDTSKQESTSRAPRVYELSFASIMPAGGHYETQIINYFDDELNRASNGRLKLKVYAGGSLVTAPDMFDAVKAGVVDIGITYMATVPGRFPVSSVFELPGKYASAKAVSYAFSEAMETLKPAEFSGFKVLMYYASGPGVILSQKKISTMEDLKGLQMRTNSTLAPVVAKLGGTPVTMNMGEIYEGLRNGVVDAYIGATETVSSYKFYEVAKNLTYYPWLDATHVMIMNEDVYKALPDDLRKILDDVTKKVWEDRVVDYFDIEGQAAVKIAKDSGVQVSEIAPSEIDRMTDTVAPLLVDYERTLTEAGYDGNAILKLYHELMAKYNQMYPLSHP